MPTIRKSVSSIGEMRREIFHAISWQVRPNVWSPPTDVYETDQRVIVKVEIAGMREEDFEVAVEDNILIVSGFRPDLNERRAYHQMEIRFGRFEIVVDLPFAVEVENAVAEYKDGFLLINLPKENPKQIKAEQDS